MEVVYLPSLDLASIISRKNMLKRFGQSGISKETLERSQKNPEGETLRLIKDCISRSGKV
jgi:hypothetical protein